MMKVEFWMDFVPFIYQLKLNKSPLTILRFLLLFRNWIDSRMIIRKMNSNITSYYPESGNIKNYYLNIPRPLVIFSSL